MNAFKILFYAGKMVDRVLYATRLANLRVGNRPLRRYLRLVGRRLLERFLIPFYRAPLVVNNHKVVLAGGQSLIFSFAMAAGKYEEETSRLIERIIQPGMVVIDIGAHIGYYTLIAARRVGSGGKVYAFEPEPNAYAVLSENVRLNGYQNIVTVQRAVADRCGPLELFLSDANGLRADRWNRIYRVGSKDERSVVVEATTLDQFLEDEGWPQVGLMKMDIEGSEGIALDGMTRFLEKNRSLKLIIEFYPEGLQSAAIDPRDFFRRLLVLGFTIRTTEDPDGFAITDPSILLAKIEPGKSTNLLCKR